MPIWDLIDFDGEEKQRRLARQTQVALTHVLQISNTNSIVTSQSTNSILQNKPLCEAAPPTPNHFAKQRRQTPIQSVSQSVSQSVDIPKIPPHP